MLVETLAKKKEEVYNINMYILDIENENKEMNDYYGRI